MFLHTYHPSPILFQFGPVSIHWYGLLVVLSIVAGFFICLRLAKRAGLNQEHIWNLSFWLILGGLIGARLYHVFCELPYYWQNPVDIFKVWQGGVGIFGVVAAGVLVLFLYSKKSKVSFWFLADIIFVPLALGQAIVRWGNYFNQELFGLPTKLSWGIPIDFINRLPGFTNFEYFHPIFLYESIWNLIVFIILILLFKKLWEVGPQKIKAGLIFSSYLILYPLSRFFVSFARIDAQPMVFAWRLDQFISLLLVTVGILLLMFRASRSRTQK